jgi:hypothetical protein
MAVQERSGSHDSGCFEAEDEAAVRAIAAADPAVMSGLATIEIGTMMRAFLRRAGPVIRLLAGQPDLDECSIVRMPTTRHHGPRGEGSHSGLSIPT